jgi:hypothetical protein
VFLKVVVDISLNYSEKRGSGGGFYLNLRDIMDEIRFNSFEIVFIAKVSLNCRIGS